MEEVKCSETQDSDCIAEIGVAKSELKRFFAKKKMMTNRRNIGPWYLEGDAYSIVMVRTRVLGHFQHC